jgi:type IV pilus assembly protein PilV
MKNKQLNQGFSLLESLIALIVLSIGLIGASAVQVSTLKFGQVSAQRSNAAAQILAISDRMRSNLAGVRDAAIPYRFVQTWATIPSSIPATVNCAVGCTHLQIAQRDLNEWLTELNRVLPNGRAVITPTNPTTVAQRWQITVMWEEKDLVTATGGTGMKSGCPAAVAAPVEAQCLSVNFQP